MQEVEPQLAGGEMLLNDADLRITLLRGNAPSGAAIVSFAGIGRGLGGLLFEEFARTLTGGLLQHDVYFVIDKNRSWYNRATDKLEAVLLPHLAGRRLVTLGNSMGGFGALLFAARWPRCEASIAFVPQYSVHPHIVPNERRFLQWVRAIGEWRFPTCLGDAPAGCRRLVFFGVGEPHDREHEALFRAARSPGLEVFGIDNTTHELAAHLRDRGALRPLFDAIIQHRAAGDEVRGLLRSFGVAVR
jgi:pimeloyl-ACP methyl ester carboxylesterase